MLAPLSHTNDVAFLEKYFPEIFQRKFQENSWKFSKEPEKYV